MTIKKLLYSMRNWILLIIQLAIAPWFVVTTMLSYNLNKNEELPPLAISFSEYLETVTTLEKGAFEDGSVAEGIFTSFQGMFKNSSSMHSLLVTEKGFEERILEQYDAFKSKTNLNFMIGATINENSMVAWFNNQPFHPAPLAVNVLNNAILRFVKFCAGFLISP
jgi:hypothetical protein